jgi:PHD/YefM family antitoxin component YafN of YafNO toxin-antitoxin module
MTVKNTPSDLGRTLRERGARYVTSAEGQPVAALLTLEEYEHYLDLLDDEADSQDAELATRLTQAASRPAEDRLSFRDYLQQYETPRAEEVQS